MDDPACSRRSLIVSIHDVSPRFEREVEALRAMLTEQADPGRIALLVVPNYWGEAPLIAGSAFATLLRSWAEQGSDIFLHGWSHRDGTAHTGCLDALKAKHLTAGEGEFLGIDKDEAIRLIRAGRALLEDVTGKPVTGFVAPAWLYGDGAMAALADEELPLVEDHFRVWEPATERTHCCGPVITWASRSRSRICSSIAFAAIARNLLGGLDHVRLAVHPGDVGVPALCRSIGHTLQHLLGDRPLGSYGALLGADG